MRKSNLSLLVFILLLVGLFVLNLPISSASANSPPVSKDASITPSSGTSQQIFRYTISIADADNDKVYVTLFVWNYTSEFWFSLETKYITASVAEYKTLTWQEPIFDEMMPGVSKYKFEYDDGTSQGVWGPYEGPEITKKTYIITVNAFADTGVSSSPYNKDKNYGSDIDIWLMNSYAVSLTDSYMYLMFNFETFRQLIPEAVIFSAKMKVCRYAAFPNKEVSTYYCSDNNWEEDALTWNNQPIESISSLPTDTVILSSSDEMSGNQYVSTWDITSDVKEAWGSKQNLLTEVLKLETSSSYVIYDTKERDRGRYQPTLDIEYSLPSYWVNVSLSGLPSKSSTMLYLDRSSVGTLSTEKQRKFYFDDKEEHTITVEENVPEGEDARYHCSSNSWIFSSENSNEFNYIKQYYLNVKSPYGNPQGSGWYNHGSVATFSVASTVYDGNQTKHLFLEWSGDSTADMPEATIEMTEPKTVTANWKTRYYLSVNSELGEALGEGWYDSSTTVELSVTSPISEGEGKRYICTGYKLDDGLLTSGTSASITMDAPHKLIWRWKTQYYLTVNSSYGSPNPTSGWFDSDTSITASVSSPVSGISGIRYVCTAWTGTGSVPASGLGASVTFTINEPSSVTWKWETQYYLTMQADPSEGGAVSPSSGWHDSGASVSILASPESGYGFDRWTGSGSGSYNGTDSSATIIMNESINETAVFILAPMDISISISSSTSYVGFKVEINGYLTCNEIGVSKAPILLSYSVTGGESWNDITLVETGANGEYSAVWMPSATGKYHVRATWSGNTTYPGTTTIINFAVTSFEEQTVFSVTSNSTISNLAFNSTNRELTFTVTGPSDTTGYANVYIANSLVEDISDLKVYLDEDRLNYTCTSQDNSWLLYFVYQHSTHKVTINLGYISPVNIIEDYLLFIVIGAIASVILVIAFLKLRKR